MSHAPPRRSDTLEAEGDDPFDLPPAYTPSADQRHGEATVDLGPARPFQNDWQNPVSSSSSYSGGSGGQSMNGHAQHQQSWAPPPGQPPTSGSSSSAPPPPRRRKQYEPTTRPVPGQPLLHEGKLLVFPQGQPHDVCPKCHDTGYRSYDTNNPCTSCFKKYGRPYTSALRHSFSLGGEDDGPPLGVQRPLPETRPPQQQQSRPPPPPQQHYRPPSAPMHHSPPPQQSWQTFPGQMRPQPNIIPMGGNSYGPWGGYSPAPMPPPGAVVYQAGDPRIGGVPCGRCRGDGWISGGLFMLDQVTCPMCRGVGRVF